MYWIKTEKTKQGPYDALGTTVDKLVWVETKQGLYFQAIDKAGAWILGPSFKRGPFMELGPFIVNKRKTHWAVQATDNSGNRFVLTPKHIKPTPKGSIAWHPFLPQIIESSSLENFVDGLGFGPYGETMWHHVTSGNHFAVRGDQKIGPYSDLKFLTRFRWFEGTVFAYYDKDAWHIKEGRRLVGPYRAVKHIEMSPDRSQVVSIVTGPSGDYRLIDLKRVGPFPEVLPFFSWSPSLADIAYITRQGQRYFVRTHRLVRGPYEEVRDIRWSATGQDLAILAKDKGSWWIFSDWGRFGPLPSTAASLQVWPQKNRLAFYSNQGRIMTTHLWVYRKDHIGSIRTDARGLQSGSVFYDPRQQVIVRTN